MMLEILIPLEIIAFLFLALGVAPFGGKSLLNKLLFCVVAAILFFTLGVTSTWYEYTYCYVNQTISYFSLNSTISTATCANYMIENTGLGYINLGMGILTIVLGIIVMVFAITGRHDEPEE